MQMRIGKDGKDVFEENSLGGEVGKLAEGAVEPYLKTGEFGGTGGRGGGESEVLGGGGGIGCVLGVGSGQDERIHDEKKRKRADGCEESLCWTASRVVESVSRLFGLGRALSVVEDDE